MHLIDEPENLRIGFDALQRELELLIHNVEHIQDVLVDAAEAYVNDLRRLPKPYSNIRSTQHKHMLDEMGYRRAKHEEVEVGSESIGYDLLNLEHVLHQNVDGARHANHF